MNNNKKIIRNILNRYELSELMPPIWLSNIGGNGIKYKGKLITLNKILFDTIELARVDERAKLLKQMETIPDEFDCCNRLTELANKLKNIKKQSMWENER